MTHGWGIAVYNVVLYMIGLKDSGATCTSIPIYYVPWPIG